MEVGEDLYPNGPENCYRKSAESLVVSTPANSAGIATSRLGGVNPKLTNTALTPDMTVTRPLNVPLLNHLL
jgi:hypothetical protein